MISFKLKALLRSTHFFVFVGFLFCFMIIFFTFPTLFVSSLSYQQGKESVKQEIEKTQPAQTKINADPIPLDTVLYDQKMLSLANNPPPKKPKTKVVSKKNKDGTITKSTITILPPPQKPIIWPAKAPYPNAGAILPFHRIVAYYGNLYSKSMGVLGQYPPKEMLYRLNAEVEKWNKADPETPAMLALHYIAVTAQGSPGSDGKYRFRMPGSEIEKVLKIASDSNALVFLDVQVGFSNLETELPLLEKYLKMSQVHLGIDPEFSMKSGIRPGKVVGTLDAKDINFAASYLAKLVKENNLPPKVLVVHRYTENMVTNYKLIKPLPEVEVVMDMDGWGQKANKLSTYQQFVYAYPVQFTGFKLFYKNDLFEKGTTMFTPEELLKLNPRPIYIQYQ